VEDQVIAAIPVGGLACLYNLVPQLPESLAELFDLRGLTRSVEAYY